MRAWKEGGGGVALCVHVRPRAKLPRQRNIIDAPSHLRMELCAPRLGVNNICYRSLSALRARIRIRRRRSFRNTHTHTCTDVITDGDRRRRSPPATLDMMCAGERCAFITLCLSHLYANRNGAIPLGSERVCVHAHPGKVVASAWPVGLLNYCHY